MAGVDRQPAEVNGNDSLRACAECASAAVSRAAHLTNVHQDRPGTKVGADLAAGREGGRRDNDLVSSRDSRRLQGKVERGGARTDSQGVGDLQSLTEGPLEGMTARSRGEPSGSQHFHGSFDLPLANGRPVEGDAVRICSATSWAAHVRLRAAGYGTLLPTVNGTPVLHAGGIATRLRNYAGFAANALLAAGTRSAPDATR